MKRETVIKKHIRNILFTLLAFTLIACKKNIYTQNKMKIEWSKLTTEGLEGNLQKGVSASYAALVNGKLIVAGGANFPDKLGFEGGAKAYYDEILIYNEEENRWDVIGKLPEPAAYGVSVPLSDGALWIGGNTATKSLSTCSKITYNNVFESTPLPSLPVTLDNFAGCSIDDKVFVGGGNADGKPSNKIFYINTKSDTAWTALPDFPGIPRVQPVMAALQKKGKEFVYLMGGFFGGDASHAPEMANDVFRYDISEQKWEKVSVLRLPNETTFFSLTGATAMPIDDRFILCTGGVNYTIFLDAITQLYAIANNTSLSDAEKKKRNFEFSKKYMTQPVSYYRFNQECLLFDSKTNEWKVLDISARTARAGATLVYDKHTFYNVQGEVKPGVRSSETWKGKINEE